MSTQRERLSDFSAFVSQLAAAKRVTATAIVVELKRARGEGQLRRKPLALPQVKAFLDGRGKAPGTNVLKVLREYLCTAPDEHERFRQLQLGLQSRGLAADLISTFRKCRYLPLLYPPLCDPGVGSGVTRGFVDQLLNRMGQVAFIDWEVPERLGSLASRGVFNMNDRIGLLESNKADVLVNLISLPRLRKLQFVSTPISISLNGVMLRSVAHADEIADNAASFLSGALDSVPPMHHRFRALTVAGEVGGLQVSCMTKLTSAAWITSEVVATLSPSELAWYVNRPGTSDAPVVLFCDELTALHVLRELHNRGRLIFPPNTDGSISRSRRRRSLPAHRLGIGYLLASDNAKVADQSMRWLRRLFKQFIESEREAIAKLYEGLYWSMTADVRQCLERDEALYIAGVRKVQTDAIKGEFRAVLIDQNARAHVRRCLQLSRRTIELLRNDDPWTPVVRRAHERIRSRESNDRSAVKASLLAAIAMAAGEDPCDGLSSERTRIELALKSPDLLRRLLERDLDIDLPTDDRFFDPLRDGRPSAAIERFVSALQDSLSESSNRPKFTVVLNWHEVATDVQVKFQASLDIFRDHAKRAKDTSITRWEMTRQSDTRLVALALGEPVGGLWFRPSRGRLELVFMWVVDHMRSGGVGRLMLRKMLEMAADQSIESVYFTPVSVPQDSLSWLKDTGFQTEAGDKRYAYVLGE